MNAIKDTEMNSVNKSIKGETASKGKSKFRETQRRTFLHLV